MLAICSDLDETPDRHAYLESTRFLNTTGTTSMGPGVGLEVGNTIYFDMAPDQFAYWNTDERGREMVRALIRSGHIDALHSFGDHATTRAHAERALTDLAGHGCRLSVWIDHAVAPTNFGADIMHGHGDIPGDAAYHADLTRAFGIRFVWRGRVTSVLGQNVPRRLRGIWRRGHAVESAVTMAKEAAKGALAACGQTRYAIHGANSILRDGTLRDGQPVLEFLRSNPHWGGVSRGDTAGGLAEVLTGTMLRQLVERRGVCILYTHLGKTMNSKEPFEKPTRDALLGLARFRDDGQVLVATTRRLLGYCLAARQVTASLSVVEGEHRITLDVPQPGLWDVPLDLDGLSFYVADPARTNIFVGREQVRRITRNPPDETGRPSVSLPWDALEFPAV
jgi:hypothetical protein